jgi:hypothetical protein
LAIARTRTRRPVSLAAVATAAGYAGSSRRPARSGEKRAGLFTRPKGKAKPRRPDAGKQERSMGRVGYKNEHISHAIEALDDLEQTMGWNMRCAFPGQGGDDPGTATHALIQILQAAAKARRYVALAEAECLKLFEQQSERIKQGTTNPGNAFDAGTDMDVFDSARHLLRAGVNLNDRAAVERSIINPYEANPELSRRFVDWCIKAANVNRDADGLQRHEFGGSGFVPVE